MGGQVHSWVEQTLDTLKETAGGASLTKPGSELFLSIMCLTTSVPLLPCLPYALRGWDP